MRLDIERQKKLEPQRMQAAVNELSDLGFSLLCFDTNKIEFYYKGQKVLFFPYSGWHSGKSIIAGRGLKNLLKQIKP